MPIKNYTTLIPAQRTISEIQSRGNRPDEGEPPAPQPNLAPAAASNRPAVLSPEPPAAAKTAPKLHGSLIVGDDGLVEAATPAPILHRAPDGGITTILRSPDGRNAQSLRVFEGE